MEQKKNNINQDNPTRTRLVIQAPNKKHSLSVDIGTFIETDEHTFLCVEPPTSLHCADCDATRELCYIMCCKPNDRQDRKFVEFKCVPDK